MLEVGRNTKRKMLKQRKWKTKLGLKVQPVTVSWLRFRLLICDVPLSFLSAGKNIMVFKKHKGKNWWQEQRLTECPRSHFYGLNNTSQQLLYVDVWCASECLDLLNASIGRWSKQSSQLRCGCFFCPTCMRSPSTFHNDSASPCSLWDLQRHVCSESLAGGWSPIEGSLLQNMGVCVRVCARTVEDQFSRNTTRPLPPIRYFLAALMWTRVFSDSPSVFLLLAFHVLNSVILPKRQHDQ